MTQALLPVFLAHNDCKASPYLALFARAPRQYRAKPTRSDATVPPTSFNSNPSLFAESPGGTSEATIATSTTTNPNPLMNQTPGIPQGIRASCLFCARSLRRDSLIAAANM